MKLGKKLVLAFIGSAVFAVFLLYSHQALAEMKSKYDFISTGTSADYPRCSCDTTDQGLDCANGIMEARAFLTNPQETVSRCSDTFTVTKGGSSVRRYKIYGYAGQVDAGKRVQLTELGESSLSLKSAGYTNGGLFCLNNKCVMNWGKTPLDTGKGRFCIGGKCILSIPKQPQIITDLQVDNPLYTTEVIPELWGRFKRVKPGETYKLTWSVRNAAKLILREGKNAYDITKWQTGGWWNMQADGGYQKYTLYYQIEAYGPGDELIEKGKQIAIEVDYAPGIYEQEFRSETSNRSAYIAFKKYDVAAVKIFYQSDVNNPIGWYGCSVFDGSCPLLDSGRQEYHLADTPRKYRIIVYNAFGGKSPPYDFILQREHEYSPIRENNSNLKWIGYSDAKKESPWCHSEPERKSGFVCEGDWEGRCYDGWAYNKGPAGYGGWGYGQWVYCYNNLNPD